MGLEQCLTAYVALGQYVRQYHNCTYESCLVWRSPEWREPEIRVYTAQMRTVSAPPDDPIAHHEHNALSGGGRGTIICLAETDARPPKGRKWAARFASVCHAHQQELEPHGATYPTAPTLKLSSSPLASARRMIAPTSPPPANACATLLGYSRAGVPHWVQVVGKL